MSETLALIAEALKLAEKFRDLEFKEKMHPGHYNFAVVEADPDAGAYAVIHAPKYTCSLLL